MQDEVVTCFAFRAGDDEHLVTSLHVRSRTSASTACIASSISLIRGSVRQEPKRYTFGRCSPVRSLGPASQKAPAGFIPSFLLRKIISARGNNLLIVISVCGNISPVSD